MGMSRILYTDSRGTAAASSAQFAVAGTTIAYAAGSGVIVGTLEGSEIVGKTLYVPNSGEGAPPLNSPGFSGHSHANVEDLRDLYGFPANGVVNYGTADAEDELASPFSGAKFKERVRAVTCVAISPNKKVLAVGESGYQPRVLLYSLARDASKQPFAVIAEHKFGINHLCFSPDLKYLCSLGNITDGFLHVWRYSASSVVLKASNKCSSVVHGMVWHRNGIVTCGLRFLKCWHLEAESATKPALKGRNVILGRFLDTSFLAMVPDGDSVLLLAGTSIFRLHLRSEPKLSLAYESAYPLQGLVLAQKLYAFRETEIEDIFLKKSEVVSPTPPKGSPKLNPISPLKHSSGSASPPRNPTSPRKASSPSKSRLSPRAASPRLQSPLKSPQRLQFPGKQSSKEIDFIVSAKSSENGVVYLTSDGTITLVDPETRASSPLVLTAISNITGAKYCGGGILAFSKDGRVEMILENGQSRAILNFDLPKADYISNELTAVEASSSEVFLGDKYGTLYVLEKDSEKKFQNHESQNSESQPEMSSFNLVLAIKVHSSTVNDIIHFSLQNTELLCTVSRDRMIQILHKNNGSWDLLQTLPTHTANLTCVRFSAPYIYVCSADRTLSVHEVKVEEHEIVVVQKKILSFKSTPLCMEISDDLVVSTNDRSIHVYGPNLEHKKTTKLYSDKNDALCVEKFALINGLICAFSSDKSLRLFQLSSGKHLACAWGHMEPIIGLFDTGNFLFSLGKDGCFQWKLCVNVGEISGISSRPPSPDVEISQAKVARKIMKREDRRSEELFRELGEPDSPTLRLTSATLKRLEARKKVPDLDLSPSREKFLLRKSSKITPKRSDAVERSSAYIAAIRAFADKQLFSEEEKKELAENLRDLLGVLGDRCEAEILEKYSERLVNLVEEKLSF